MVGVKHDMAGLTWPLRLFFVATLVGSFVAYFGGEIPQQPNPTAGFWLLLAAIISAGALFIPKLLLYLRAPRIEKASEALKTATADVQKLADNYQKIADAYQQIADASAVAQSIDKRLKAIEAKLL